MNVLFQAATAFLSAYSAEDVYTIEIDGESSALWDISPPSIQHLYNDFMNKSMDVNMYTSVIIKRSVSSCPPGPLWAGRS